MTRDEFVARRKATWDELERLLARPRTPHDSNAVARLAALYREVCADLMRARSLGFGPDLRRHLDALASRAHNFLYRSPRHHAARVLRRLAIDFPRAVRNDWAFVLVASLLFGLPFVSGVAGTLASPAFAERVLPSESLDQLARSYADGFAQGRDTGEDAAMAGFYVWNNVGIAFRCFATGVLFGAGSAFFLVYNGVATGAVLGYVGGSGHGRNILTFVSGHASFELIAIVISGAAGLKLGYSLLDTGGLTRIASLRRAAASALTLVLGAAAMLGVAALVEAFWSPSSAPDRLKWAVGVTNLLLVIAFLLWGGRGRERVA